MSKLMLIDSTHPEETRVAVVSNGQIEDFDFEARAKRQLRGNIYLAKVTRVEPSLQAAFVDYGGNRHGFLAFGEIHPDYYQIPKEDRDALLEEAAAEDERARKKSSGRRRKRGKSAAESAGAGADVKTVVSDTPPAENEDADAATEADEVDAVVEPAEEAETDAETAVEVEADQDDSVEEDEAEEVEADAEDETAAVEEDEDDDSDDDDDGEEQEATVRRRAAVFQRKYRIQEVIRRRQVLLVQVVKEERGNKGAALTTYLSLAGRYCVLMPNTSRAGGVSRKITNANDRRRLKDICADLEIPRGAGLIVRTAGAKRTRNEITRDFEYLTSLWKQIVARTIESMAPCLIHEEGHLVLRAVRDLYDKDIEQIIVDGDEAYEEAHSFVEMLMPTHARKVVKNETGAPLFVATGIEDQLETIFSPIVQLPSGGYIVINQTEALVAVDVNSGKATRERNVEATALKTNLEAATEVCRQMRLRDLAGLIVIDFIDMEDSKNNRAVERRMAEGLKIDRARVQTGRISQFGLFEISRQRRRAGVLELSSEPCPHCNGTGRVRSIESAALQILRMIEARAADPKVDTVLAEAPSEVALYILNEKRSDIAEIESANDVIVRIETNTELRPGDCELESRSDGHTVAYKPLSPSELAKLRPLPMPESDEDEDEEIEGDEAEADADDADTDGRRRRGRRGGRRRRGGSSGEPAQTQQEEGQSSGRGGRRRRRGGRDGAPRVPDIAADGGEMLDAIASIAFIAVETPVEATPEPIETSSEAAAVADVAAAGIETDALAEASPVEAGETVAAEAEPAVAIETPEPEAIAEPAPETPNPSRARPPSRKRPKPSRRSMRRRRPNPPTRAVTPSTVPRGRSRESGGQGGKAAPDRVVEPQEDRLTAARNPRPGYGRNQRGNGPVNAAPCFRHPRHYDSDRARGAEGDVVMGVAGYFRSLAVLAALALAPLTAAAQSCLSPMGCIRDAEIEADLREYSDPIFEAAGLNPKDIRIFIVNDETLNAFVAAGLNVSINTGTIMAAETPEQLKGVIAHETCHMACGHAVTRDEAFRAGSNMSIVSMGLGVLAMAAGAPDAGMAILASGQQFGLLTIFKHTRTEESVADQQAVKYLQATHQSAKGLIEFFDKYRAQENLSEARREPYFRSHPLSADRIGALRRRVAEAEPDALPQSERSVDQLARMKAKLIGFLKSPMYVDRYYPKSDLSIPARYARAINYYRPPSINIKGALEEIEGLIELEPDNPYFQELKGQILFENGRVEESIEPNRKSVELAPHSPLLKVNLARSLIELGGEDQVQEAVNLLIDSVAEDHENPFAWNQLARAYAKQDKVGDADLATAEEAYAMGNIPRANYFSMRASKKLPPGTPNARRASDIAAITDPRLPGNRPRSGR
ncbi:MAG: Rne/Rng family ribonuclease [Hyphomonadaceae bacterium]